MKQMREGGSDRDKPVSLIDCVKVSLHTQQACCALQASASDTRMLRQPFGTMA